jgi:hypothetical protein
VWCGSLCPEFEPSLPCGHLVRALLGFGCTFRQVFAFCLKASEELVSTANRLIERSGLQRTSHSTGSAVEVQRVVNPPHPVVVPEVMVTVRRVDTDGKMSPRHADSLSMRKRASLFRRKRFPTHILGDRCRSPSPPCCRRLARSPAWGDRF